MTSIRPCPQRQRRDLSQFLRRGAAHRLNGEAIQDRDEKDQRPWGNFKTKLP